MLMDIRIAVAGEGPNDAHELRRWLSAEPQLRGRIRSGATHAEPPGGAMGTAADALLAVLAPGGVAAVFAGAVVAWAQTRRGSQTITITRPDGTEISVSATHVRGLTAQQTADLARQLAEDVAGTSRPDDSDGDASDADADARMLARGAATDGAVRTADTRTEPRTPLEGAEDDDGRASAPRAEPGRPVAPRDDAPPTS
ncbi:effector-associated constant component EACC1 [Streptomyces litmocidini]|uniref:effector-associated constant component EACC1 n=1 Tax=Streptomyces litmocidini TaxID=67318 RepID=UPI0036F4B6DA